jgi:hypothetical protein
MQPRIGFVGTLRRFLVILDGGKNPQRFTAVIAKNSAYLPKKAVISIDKYQGISQNINLFCSGNIGISQIFP